MKNATMAIDAAHKKLLIPKFITPHELVHINQQDNAVAEAVKEEACFKKIATDLIHKAVDDIPCAFSKLENNPD